MEPIEQQADRPARVEHVFVVRIWYEAGARAAAWRGSVEHPGSGARRYFTDYAALTAFIEAATGAGRGADGSGAS